MSDRYKVGALRLGLIFPVVIFSGVAFASSYQSELGFDHSSTSIDPGNDITISLVSAGYSFAPIDVDGPLAEAKFIAKASGISAGISSVDVGIGSASLDGQGYSLALSYLLPQSDITLTAQYFSQNVSGSGFDLDVSSTSMSIGKYINDLTLVGFTYRAGLLSSLTASADTDTSETIIYAKQLINNINVEASYARDNSDDGTVDETNATFEVSGDYYIDNTFSIGAGYLSNTGDNTGEEGSTVSIGVVKFINETTSFEVSYDDFSADSGNDSNTISFSLAGRY